MRQPRGASSSLPGVATAKRAPSGPKEHIVANPRVRLKTSLGGITVELDEKNAPVSVDNFLQYALEGGYDGTIFHRVIPGFMIQGGGFTPDMQERPTRTPIKNEATNGLRNLRGSLAMARTDVPDSATNQFFINTVDNPFLDHRRRTKEEFGYAVFGWVTEGMDVIDRIAKVPTGTSAGHQDVPVSPVLIESVECL
jgi:cyclophilin family peptidyl-prolyl cis-trans isomerase